MRRLVALGGRLKDDAIFRFWITHMAVFLLAWLICLFGFNRALAIVEQSIVRENRNLLRQGISETESTLENIYRLGLEISRSDTLLENAGKTPSTATERYYLIKTALSEIARAGSYYDSSVTQTGFFYQGPLERFLYGGAAYDPSVFQTYWEKWGITEAEWLTIYKNAGHSPFLQPLQNGRALYVFPCWKDYAPRDTFCAMMFVISPDLVQTDMPFLLEFSAYTLMICDEQGELLFVDDGLQCANDLLPHRQRDSYITRLEDHLVLHAHADSGHEYLLVLPQQEAMLGLQRLQITVFILLLAAFILEAVLTFFYSLRNGRPINAIATALHQESNNAAYSTNLQFLNERVAQELEEKRQDRPALQTRFFHELLKASFVSTAEMQLQARHAGLELQGDSYCAVSLRLFPYVDLDAIDAQTVAASNALQGLLEEKLRTLYPGRFWQHRQNIVVTLFIFESVGQDSWDNLLQALTEATRWLEEESHIQVCWGVGTPCDDLMQFWRSAEEANSMLEFDGSTSSVRLYLDAPSVKDPYFLPYSIEDALVQGLRTGNLSEVHQSMERIRTENLSRRTLTAKQLQKLNSRISTILRDQIERLDDNADLLHMVEDLDSAYQDGNLEYFIQARYLCGVICKATAKEKSALRSDRINAILRYIQEEFNNPELGLTLVGEQFGISEAYLSTLFKAEIGSNFGDYLEEVRIRAACNLLQQGMRVADVAQSTGYNSVQSFRRAFKRVKGVSPSTYRE